MPVSVDAYVATSMFYSIFVGIAGGFIGFLIPWLLGASFLFVIALAAFFAVIFGFLAYQLFLFYPGMAASERTRKIDAALPYTIGFMHALSRSGATIVDIFKELSTRDDVGELKKEAQVFVRDIELLGQDPLTALRNLARTTPSEKFKSFLEVLVSIVETGGDVTPYFSSKSLELQNSLKEEQKKTITSLEFLAEIYVILVIFAPLLFLSIVLFMSLIPEQPFDVRVVRLIAYGWIPMGTLAFAVLLSTTSREKIGGRARMIRPSPKYRDVTLVPATATDRMVLQRLRGALGQVRFKEFLSNPFRIFTQNPSYVLFLSVPIAMFYFLVISPAVTPAALFFTFAIGGVPYAIAYEFRSRRRKQIDEALPDFLKSLSSATRSGLTLPRAITVASTAEMGPLTEEVRRARRDIEWGSSATEALARLEGRIAISDTASRATALIRKAGEAEQDISDVIDIVMADVETERTLRKERSTSMFVYQVIIIFCFVIFLVVAWFLVDALLSPGLELPMPIKDVKELFYYMLLIMGFCGGFIAAQMGEEDLRGGVKYALGMMFIAWLIFEYTVMPRPIRVAEEAEAALAMLAML
jgi:flagellar protein FlaJ